MSFFQKLFGGADRIAEKIAQELERQERRWREMPSDELIALDDVQLLQAVYARTSVAVEAENFATDRTDALQDAKRIFYTAYLFDAAVSNGGLCYFLSNYGSTLVHNLEEGLWAVGAEAQRELWHSFLTQNDIDLQTSDVFFVSSDAEVRTLQARYQFDAFDSAYENLPSMHENLVAYTRQHVGEF